MPRHNRSHRSKGALRLEAQRRQERENKLAELRQDIYRLQAERRRADEDWRGCDTDVAGHDEEISTNLDLSGEDYRPGFEHYDLAWWNSGPDDRRA